MVTRFHFRKSPIIDPMSTPRTLHPVPNFHYLYRCPLRRENVSDVAKRVPDRLTQCTRPSRPRSIRIASAESLANSLTNTSHHSPCISVLLVLSTCVDNMWAHPGVPRHMRASPSTCHSLSIDSSRDNNLPTVFEPPLVLGTLRIACRARLSFHSMSHFISLNQFPVLEGRNQN